MASKTRRRSQHVTCKHCGRRFRSITVLHLRRIHGYEGEHPIEDYKAEFGLRFAMCGDSRRLISEAKEEFWDDRDQHWTPGDVLSAIGRIYRAGRNLRRRYVSVSLYQAGRRLFGSWQAAVEAMGLNYEHATGVRRWSRAKVIARIRKLAADGECLHATYIEECYPYLHSAAVRLFPKSWAKALRAAGINPTLHRMPRGTWTRESAEDWVRQRVAKEKPILARDAPRDLFGFVHRRLGVTWTDFVESLAIPYPGIKRRRDWTKRKLVEEIRRWGAEGHRLNYRAVKTECQALIHQARKYFGSWDRARAAAGV